jgi:FecR protein
MKNKIAWMIGTLVLGASVWAGAQVSEEVPLESQEPQPESQGQQQAQPTSSVARISLIKGDVSTQRGDSGDWATAALNQPMVVSDKVATGVNSRAEVQLDHGNILRLGDNTEASLANLSRTQVQIQMTHGLINYSVFKGTESQVEIDMANVSIRPAQGDGVYRVEVNSEGETKVIVRKGSAEIATPQGSTQVEQGQMVIVRGGGDDTQYKVDAATSKDTWDTWNIERDRTIRDADSWSNTNRYYVGSEDLDTYGRWVTVPDYGPVWSPAAGPGWAPYRSGRWVWEPGWGWTWVSYEPWGWAPYHYGRWFVYNSSWVWWPGPARGYPAYRPVWAPAYVSFIGFGGGVSVGFGFGSVGWLPVGPCDTFYPWYGRYGSHYHTVNVTNVTVINNFHNGPGRGFGGIAPLRSGGAYSNLRMAAVNERVRGGISTVPTGEFGTGRARPVGVSGDTFRGGRVIAGNLPVVPTREALSVTNRPAAASTLQRGGQQRFFSQSRPAAAPPSFDRQVSQMQQSIQRNGGGQAFSRGPSQNSVGGASAGTSRDAVARPAPGVRAPSGGFNNASGASVSSDRTGRPAASDSSGWRRFSDSNNTQHNGAMNRPSGMSSGASTNPSIAQPTGGMNHSSGMSSGAASNVPRPGNSAGSGASTNDGGWRHFTPQPGGNVQSSPNHVSNGMNTGGMNGRASDYPSRNEMSRPQMESVGGRGTVQDSPRGYSRPPLEMRQPIVTPRPSEVRGSAPRESAPSRPSGGGGGGGNHGGSGGGNHGGGGGPHGGSGRR